MKVMNGRTVKPPCDAAGCSDPAPTTFTAMENGPLGGREWNTGDVIHYCWPHAQRLYRGKDPLDES